MTEPRRRRSTRKPRRVRGFDFTNLWLALAAVLAALPWLLPISLDTQPAPRNAAEAVAARGISVATNQGATR